MRTLNNNIVLNNNLKSGKSDSIIDTIKLLAKLGLLETKKKKAKPRLMIEGGPSDSFGGPRQNNKMFGSVTYGPSDQDKKASGEFTKSGPTISGIPTIEDINKQKQALEYKLQDTEKKLEQGNLKPEEFKQLQFNYASLNDKIQKLTNEVLPSAFELVNINQEKIKQEGRRQFNVIDRDLSKLKSEKFAGQPTYYYNYKEPEEQPKFSQSEEPFEGVKGEDSGAVYESNEQDFTNQGSQDLPDTVKEVDVSATPTELLEDEQTTDFIPMKEEPEMKIPAKEEEDEEEEEDKVVLPSDEYIENVQIKGNGFYINPFVENALDEFQIEKPKKNLKLQDLKDYATKLNAKQDELGELIAFPENYEKLKAPELKELIKQKLQLIGSSFKMKNPTFNPDTRKWELAE